MSFDDRLRQAIERGQKRGETRAQEAQKQALTEEECKRLHSQLRLRLSEQIEACIKRLPNVFSGVSVRKRSTETRDGAGACFRDDLRIVGGQRSSNYSRLEMTVRPYSSFHVLGNHGQRDHPEQRGLQTATTTRNWKKWTKLNSATLIDAWVLEYVEMFAATK